MSYWDNFYKNHKLNPPSQFAAFVLQEYFEYECFIDIGCGNGRDTFLFSLFNKDVYAVDASAIAIESIKKQDNLNKIKCIKSDVENLKVNTFDIKQKKTVIYSRFFLHAIDYKKQENFLRFIDNFLKISKGSIAALEFRTNHDENLSKATSDHFRRYIKYDDFYELIKSNYKILYTKTGTGLAKYKNDDAFVARIIFTMK
jgi:tellurite methyltransferase